MLNELETVVPVGPRDLGDEAPVDIGRHERLQPERAERHEMRCPVVANAEGSEDEREESREERNAEEEREDVRLERPEEPFDLPVYADRDLARLLIGRRHDHVTEELLLAGAALGCPGDGCLARRAGRNRDR